MAKCVKQRYQPPSVTVVTLPPQEIEFVLRLTEEEAKVLRKVMGRITGSEAGPRGHTSKIYWALGSAGVASADIKVPDSIYLEAK